MRALLASFMLAAGMLATGNGNAQEAAPFSMLPGRPAAPVLQPQPVQQAQPPATPFNMHRDGSARPASPSLNEVKPSATQTGTVDAPIGIERSGAQSERPILPFETIRLDGEIDARSWVVHLTQDEAASRASISIGYQNAIVVMPEASRLRAIINGELVANIPIASSQDIQRSIVSIRPGLLRSGQNIIRLEAIQRHRTDCTIRATYDLWTDVDAASTKLIFAGGSAKALRSLDDLPAVGTDSAGITTIRLIAPRIYRPEVRDRLLRLAQMVALRGRYAHPVIQVMESDTGPTSIGTIKIVMGIANELRGVVPALPDSASTQPLAILMQDGPSSPPYVIVTGPTWSDLDTAINIIGGPFARIEPLQRNAVDTASWHWPDVPTVLGKRSLRFADLGVPTQEFSGRRFRTRFAVNLPSDFYATEYGEATLLLDAAHTSAVKPGSHFDLYVNGKISTTMAVTSRSGVFRRHQIRVPLKNFKAGINHIALEAILLTEADERCAPGETLSEVNRFVLFDSTSLDFPDFGRMGRQPDLSGLSSGGFPQDDLPATFVLPRSDASNYSAAATFLARMARDLSSPVHAQFSNAANAADRSVVFIGAIGQIPQELLGRVRVSDSLRTIWQSSPAPTRTAIRRSENTDDSAPTGRMIVDEDEPGSTDEIRRRWRQALQPKGVVHQTVEAVRNWMEQTFSLSIASLNLDDDGDRPYEPAQRMTLLLAQGTKDRTDTWTLVTARTEEALAAEVARLTEPLLWSQVSGRIAALEPDQAKLDIVPVEEYRFVQTVAFSLSNLRLVAANWMSSNILQYAFLMVVLCTLLGGGTYLLLRQLGRKL